MEKQKRDAETSENIVHEFYCDDCGSFLGTSFEESNGWYEQCGKFCHDMHIGGRSFTIKKHLCDGCKEKAYQKMFDALISIGFEDVTYRRSGCSK